MEKKELRPYQLECLNTLRRRLHDVPSPLLVNASVGAGKSLIIAELLYILEKANWRALCLTMNSTLIQQNSETYETQGGRPGVYCSGLGRKDTHAHVIFGSPHSVIKGIKLNKSIADVPFNLIIVDEAHNINHNQGASMYMRILNHYGMMAQSNRCPFRVVGLTGTPYRGKSVSIVGPEEYFKEEVCSISSHWLIKNQYLVPPIFGKTHVDSFDMSRVRVDNTGKFKHEDLQAVIDKSQRLTSLIMKEVINVVEDGRNGTFIFASTLKHAAECMRSLPPEQSACITGDTTHEERKIILDKARNGEIKYLVNVATLLVGVDVPNFDVCAWLRPTESLTLYTQGIGRVLRLSDGKVNALVLDYAGNLDRHGDIDDPLINEALQPPQSEDPNYCILCHDCNTLNKETARRCIGLINEKRCDHYFVFKECRNQDCRAKNDIVCRECRTCGIELIDPNKKLHQSSNLSTFDVLEAQYWVSVQGYTNYPVIHAKYKIEEGFVFECYYTNSDKSRNVFYNKFVKPHFKTASAYWPFLGYLSKMKEMIEQGEIKTPLKVICRKDTYNRNFITRKIFSPADCKTVV